MIDEKKTLFKFSGDEENLRIALKNDLEEQDIDKFINFISNNSFNNGVDYIKTEVRFTSATPGMMSFMVAQKNYNINLTKSAFILLATIIDLKIKIPIATTAINMAGIGTHTITKIDERNGEKCILFEVIKSSNQHFTISRFDNHGECINNNLGGCQFRHSDLCDICKEDISDILNSLEKRNVIKKEAGSYKYMI